MKLNKINLSGVSYDIEDLNAAKTVELTQAQYDALTVKDPNTFYVITDAQAADLSSYYTKTETDGLLDTKLDASAYTPTDLSNYYTKSETSGATQISTALAGKADTATTYTKTEVDNAITAATSTKQDTLVSGTNIKTVNNESLLGEGNIEIQGGGATYSAGTNISIDTANTINCTLPITANTSGSIAVGRTVGSSYLGQLDCFTLGTNLNKSRTNGVAAARQCYINNIAEAAFGSAPNTVGNYTGDTYFRGREDATLFTVGNGDTNFGGRHNALEIRQNGDLYFADTDNTTYSQYNKKPMVRLQDMYGALGGLKLVKLTQTEYDALATKDSNTLYVIVN